ncbi:conserved hypothetical protein [delta proteobacterium NaphS2]|nr:conserved hypothetical protein [delta proteobacterium NaphS2]
MAVKDTILEMLRARFACERGGRDYSGYCVLCAWERPSQAGTRALRRS